MIYLIGQNFGGKNCRKSDLLPKILSAKKFSPPKILSGEIFCPLKSKTCLINTNLMLSYFSCDLYGKITIFVNRKILSAEILSDKVYLKPLFKRLSSLFIEEMRQTRSSYRKMGPTYMRLIGFSNVLPIINSKVN